jgi:hypothetical protein
MVVCKLGIKESSMQTFGCQWSCLSAKNSIFPSSDQAIKFASVSNHERFKSMRPRTAFKRCHLFHTCSFAAGAQVRCLCLCDSFRHFCYDFNKASLFQGTDGPRTSKQSTRSHAAVAAASFGANWSVPISLWSFVCFPLAGMTCPLTQNTCRF